MAKEFRVLETTKQKTLPVDSYQIVKILHLQLVIFCDAVYVLIINTMDVYIT